MVGASGCDYLPWYPEGREDPVAVARGFLAAARRGDCKEAWTYFSPQTQEKIRQQSRRAIQSAPDDSVMFAPHRIHCSPYDSYRPSTVRLASSDSTRATVKVMERDAPRTLALTRDSGGWRVVPEVPEDRRLK
jgi:hypothetical protein